MNGDFVSLLVWVVIWLGFSAALCVVLVGLDRALDRGMPEREDADDPEEYLAPLRGSQGRHARLDLVERRLRLAHHILDRIARGRRLPR